MNRKYVAAGLISFATIIGWNVFLIHRDAELFSAYDKACAEHRSNPNCIYSK